MTRTLSRAAAMVALSVMLLGARPAVARGYLDDWHPYQTYWAVEWSAAVPVTGLQASYISNPGWLSGGFAIRVGAFQRLAVGASGNWNWFDQTFPFMTVANGNFTFTGPVYRRLSTFTALATVHYYLTQTSVQPFLGVGFGGIWTAAFQQVVNRPETTYVDGLALAGEVGVLVNVVQQLGLYASGRYQFNLATFAGTKNPQWASGQIGVAYFF